MEVKLLKIELLKKLLWVTFICSSYQNVSALDLSGNIGAEQRVFIHEPAISQQHNHYTSISSEVEFYHEWNNGNNSFIFTPFVRYDQYDEQRSHVDIRELNWLHVAEQWEIRFGLSKVFWGVAETRHLVDIINQTDLVESFDGEEKLGQTMVSFSTVRDWGILDIYILPGFRERTFAGLEGRLRAPLAVDTDHVVYESAAKQKRVDMAIRWSHTLGDMDLALAHFSGTSREPRLIPSLSDNELVAFTPYYDVIDQSSLVLSYVAGACLWKLEALTRSGQQDRYSALTGGFEYTFVGLGETALDLGVLMEYHFDDRRQQAATAFQDDVFIGGRLAFNDVQSTDLLSGVVHDNDTQSKAYFVEFSRRIGDSFKLSLEGRYFSGSDVVYDFLNVFAEEDYWQLNFEWYF